MFAHTEDELRQVKHSQGFIGGKFDEVLGAIDSLRSDYNYVLREENSTLKQRVNELDSQYWQRL